MVREAITLPSWGSTVEDPNLPELRTVVILGSIYQAGTVSWADARPDPDRGGNFRAPSRRSPATGARTRAQAADFKVRGRNAPGAPRGPPWRQQGREPDRMPAPGQLIREQVISYQSRNSAVPGG